MNGAGDKGQGENEESTILRTNKRWWGGGVGVIDESSYDRGGEDLETLVALWFCRIGPRVLFLRSRCLLSYSLEIKDGRLFPFSSRSFLVQRAGFAVR